MLTMPKPLWYAVIPVSGLVMIGSTLWGLWARIRGRTESGRRRDAQD
jgi:hypothetical protein